MGALAGSQAEVVAGKAEIEKLKVHMSSHPRVFGFSAASEEFC